jgi:glycine C-acetyltransferase
LNFCSNNYLGLSSHPEVVQAAKDTLDTHGFGMSSVRFICGTQDIQTLEKKFPIFMVLKILFYMQQLLMQTEF